jgi:copper homeostasis protein
VSTGVPLLEVIALTPNDAVAAERGGADRLELVRRIDTGGLTPTLEQFQAIRSAVDLPLRVMLRTNAGFRVSTTEVERLLREVDDLRAAGADQFVFGFLDAAGDLAVDALSMLCSATNPRAWTLHHAFDQAADTASAWAVARELPHLDAVLSGGVRGDLGRGLQALCDRAGWQADGPPWLAGGGLILDFVAPLMEAGIRQFHIGRAARANHAWDRPVSVEAVRRWRELLDGSE